MMTQTIKELFERKSVRVFTGEHIPFEDKALILEAAANAPTAGCQQFYTIIDVTDRELKEKLAVSCDNQPFIAKADMVLVFLADCRKWYEGFLDVDASPRKPGEGDLVLAVTDAAIAAQNAVTAAQSLGIGSCYIGDIMENCENVKALLNLPKYVFPAAMVVFGYPTKQQEEREKPKRAAMQYVVSENRYPEMSPEDRRQMFFESRKLAKEGFETLPEPEKEEVYKSWMRAFADRKYNSDFAKEMTRSVREYLKEY